MENNQDNFLGSAPPHIAPPAVFKHEKTLELSITLVE